MVSNLARHDVILNIYSQMNHIGDGWGSQCSCAHQVNVTLDGNGAAIKLSLVIGSRDSRGLASAFLVKVTQKRVCFDSG